MGYKWNPFTGTLDYFDSEVLSAKVLILERLASENISALKVVYLDSPTTCGLSDNSSFLIATSCGVALNAGAIGDTIKILSFGIMEDSSFAFGINEPLYLGGSGAITTTAPTIGVLTKIGYGLGAGSIYVKIEKPINL